MRPYEKTYRVLLSSGAYLQMRGAENTDLVDEIRKARSAGFRFLIATDIENGGQVMLGLEHVAMVHQIVGKATRTHQLLCLLDQSHRMRVYLNQIADQANKRQIEDLCDQFDHLFDQWKTGSEKEPAENNIP